MRFDIITIFPELFEPYLNESILKRARGKGFLHFGIHDLREYAIDSHKKTDDRPYGGGPGMVLQVEPLVKALAAIGNRQKAKSDTKQSKTKIILFSAAGKQFDAKIAAQWAKQYNQIIMISGRYEGVDERIKKIFKMQEISVGPYVLTGGEVPALVVIDALARHIPGVLGKEESLEEKRHGIGVPVYTRPEVFEWPASRRGKKGKKYKVPPILLSGDHKKIDEWRQLQKKKKQVR